MKEYKLLKYLHTVQHLLFTTCLLIAITSYAQDASKPVKDITALAATHPALAKIYGKHKQIPAGYQQPVLTALSYFPELKDTRIKFKLKKNNKGIISTRPAIGSLLQRSSKRTYIVFIYDSSATRTMPAFPLGPLNGQVGILGHEFCHIIYFNNKTGLGLLGLGLAHVSKSYMDKFEHNTDSVNIEKGLGYQLKAWKTYLTNSFRANQPAATTPHATRPESKRYMSVAAIQKQIDNNKNYQQAE
ncbi:MAG: hypothetical protein RLZZ316_740 [Bacteroidota bacterium]|jgi:hypothetical protein